MLEEELIELVLEKRGSLFTSLNFLFRHYNNEANSRENQIFLCFGTKQDLKLLLN